tara:strand:+ start:197 stop:307 length:111 start_codon:yes stop_codon:yes gene_type:complete
MFDEDAVERLARYGAGGTTEPLPGFWKAKEITSGLS